MTDQLRDDLIEGARREAEGRDIRVAQDAFRDALIACGWSREDASRFVVVVHTKDKIAVIATYYAIPPSMDLLRAAIEQTEDGKYVVQSGDEPQVKKGSLQ